MKPPKLFFLFYFLTLMHSKLFILSIFNLLPFHIWLLSALPYMRFFSAMCFFSVPRAFSRGISSECCFFPDFWRACQNKAFAVAGRDSGRASLAETSGTAWKTPLALFPSPQPMAAPSHQPLPTPCTVPTLCTGNTQPLRSGLNHRITASALKVFIGT